MHYYVVHVTWFFLERGTLKGIHPEHEVMAMIIKSYKNSFSQHVKWCHGKTPSELCLSDNTRRKTTQYDFVLVPSNLAHRQTHSIHVGTSPNWRCPNDMFCIHFIVNFRFAESLFLVFYLLSNIQTLCEPAPHTACMTIKQESKIPLVHTCFKTHTSLSMQPFSTWFPSLRFWFCSG